MASSSHRLIHQNVFIILWLMIFSSLIANNVNGLTTPSPGRVALVTGANKGIGKEIARKLLVTATKDDEDEEEPMTVILACRNPKLGKAASEELRQQLTNEKNKVHFCELDLTNKKTIDATAKEIQENYGKLDILVNNAAICFNDPTLYGKVPHTPFEKQADITIQTNFFGTLHVTQAMLPLLQKSSCPRIVNVASSAGRLSILPSQEKINQFTSPNLQMQELKQFMTQFVTDVENGVHVQNKWPNTCYGMSKLGIIAMTKILAREYTGICVNSADPGFCATDQNDNQGYVSAERGAVTPFLLATLPSNDDDDDDDDDDDAVKISGRHFYEEQEIPWSYGQF